MGNSQQQIDLQQRNGYSNYQHLTTNTQHQRALQQIYSQNNINRRAYYQQLGFGYPGPARNHEGLKIKRAPCRKITFNLDIESLKLVRVQTQPDTQRYSLEFSFQNQSKVYLTICVGAKMKTDEETGKFKDIKPHGKNGELMKTFIYDTQTANQDLVKLKFGNAQFCFDCAQLPIPVQDQIDQTNSEKFSLVIVMSQQELNQKNNENHLPVTYYIYSLTKNLPGSLEARFQQQTVEVK